VEQVAAGEVWALAGPPTRARPAGHGGSKPLPRYSFGDLATSVADLVGPDDQLTVLAYSLGGVLGLTLAGRSFDVPPTLVVGVGINVTWTADELAKARAFAQRPVGSRRDPSAASALRTSALGLAFARRSARKRQEARSPASRNSVRATSFHDCGFRSRVSNAPAPDASRLARAASVS
jgi:pimeloyl-ACP methyl ester carboxylesterase